MRMLNTCRITQNGKTSAVKPVATQKSHKKLHDEKGSRVIKS